MARLFEEVYNAAQLTELVSRVGFLPLLDSGVEGYSAEEIVSDDCRYVTFEGGGWDWPMWKWKGGIVRDGGCVYGKFFNKKAGFVSREWWPDLANYRRGVNPRPAENSIEDTILDVLSMEGSMITRHLRKACGFDGTKMRSKFDGYVTRLQMACRIVTQDFIYPHDKHDRPYGWGWALLTTPEMLLGHESMECGRTPEESLQRMMDKMHTVLPHATDSQLLRMLK